MRYFLSVALASIVLVSISCSKPDVDLTKVSLGMNKEQVIAKLGKPTCVSVQGRLEIFEYAAYDERPVLGTGFKHENFRYMFVRFINGSVESFGKTGDFDGTKNPAAEQKIDFKVNQGSASSTNVANFDLASELKNLDQMKKDNLLSDEEYSQLRQRVIDKAKAQ